MRFGPFRLLGCLFLDLAPTGSHPSLRSLFIEGEVQESLQTTRKVQGPEFGDRPSPLLGEAMNNIGMPQFSNALQLGLVPTVR